jgi:hypothetical protein
METKQVFVTGEQRQAKQVDELKALQDKQVRYAQGDKSAIKEIQANRDPKSKILETEKDYVHVAVVMRTLDADQKRFIDEARVIPIQPNAIDQMIKNSAFAAYDDAKIIHDPRPNAPEVLAVKPVAPVSQDEAAARANDAALAAREQKIKDAEKRLDEKMAALEELIAKSQKASKEPKPAEAKADAKEKAKTAEGSDLPPLP